MKVLVTAGPTREAIDPVRFISNRSSGRMGYALAAAAARRGHAVRLVSGPVALAVPDGVACTAVTTAGEMLAATRAAAGWCDVLVMAAAVADWRPAAASATKLKKGAPRLTLELVPTPDVLCELRPLKSGRFFVGFAAETDAVIAHARAKLRRKGLDLIVANDVSRPDAGFEAATNQVTLVWADGREEPWPLLSKDEVAARLVASIEARLAAGSAAAGDPLVDRLGDRKDVPMEEQV